LDTNGNLVGLPIKKPKLDIDKKARLFSRRKTQQGAEEQPGEEPAEGIKGKQKRIGSLFHRKGSSKSESSEGIGDKIKGIFRRKNKE
jgi:hypothetical protein